MMVFTPFAKPRIVIGSDGINHIDIHIQSLGQLYALADYSSSMILPVRFVESIISGQDIFLDVLPESLIDRFCHNCTICMQRYEKVES